jgi:hypothetical protein
MSTDLIFAPGPAKGLLMIDPESPVVRYVAPPFNLRLLSKLDKGALDARTRWVQVSDVPVPILMDLLDTTEGSDTPRDRETTLFLDALATHISKSSLTYYENPVPIPFLDVYKTKGASVPTATAETVAIVPDFEPTTRLPFPRPNGEVYLARDVRGSTLNDVEFLQRAVEDGLVPYLYGDPGTGKTALIEAAFGDCLETLVGEADTDATAFVGAWVQVEDRYIWVDGPLLRAMKSGCPLFVDEVGLIDARVISILNPLLDGRGKIEIQQNPEIGTVEARPGFTLLFAGNPNALGVRMSEALLSRLSLPIQVTTDYTVAMELGVPQWIINTALALTALRETGEIAWAPQMREVLDVAHLERVFSQEIAANALVSMAPAYARDRVVLSLQAEIGIDAQVLSL